MKNLTVLTFLLLPFCLLAQHNSNSNWLDGTVWKTYFGTPEHETVTELRFAKDYSLEVYYYKKGEEPILQLDTDYYYNNTGLVVTRLHKGSSVISLSFNATRTSMHTIPLFKGGSKSICVYEDECNFILQK